MTELNNNSLEGFPQQIKKIFLYSDFRYVLLSILSGLLISFSFQKFNLFFLAWIAFIPLIFCVLRNNAKKALIYGFITGFTCSFINIFWMFPFLKTNVKFFINTLIMSLIVWVFLSLFFSIWSALLSLSRKRLKPILSSVFAACTWTALELIRTCFFTAFPWNLLGYTQASFVNIIQISDITGVYGVSFLIIFVNMLVYYLIFAEKEKRKIIAIVLFVTIALPVIYGFIRTNTFSPQYGKEFTVGIVQPNIPQSFKWNNAKKLRILNKLRENARFFREKEVDIALYPETTIPGSMQKDIDIQLIIKNISQYANLNLIGGMSYEEDKIYNTIFIIDKNGDTINENRKNRLVLFGEYIPFRSLLSGFFKNINLFGNLSKQEDLKTFEYNDISFGITICSENFYPAFSGKLVKQGAKVIFNHTNDAWFMDSAALDQHFVMNVFRAVENRKNTAVSANTGISAFIDAAGRVKSKTEPEQNISFIGKLYQNDYKSIYTVFGDIFAYLCSIISFLFLIFFFISKKKKERTSDDATKHA